MRQFIRSRIVWGILLILAGLVALLVNAGFVKSNNFFWIVLELLGAVFCFSFLFENKRNWWALIPGVSLLGVAVVNLVAWISPGMEEEWGDTIVFAGIGLSFLVVFLFDRDQWWAILPAGVLFSLGAVAGLEPYVTERESGGIFLLGLGLTFMILAVLPIKAGKMAWAWIPALILLAMGTVVMITAGQLIGYIGAFIIIAIGILLIFRAIRSG